MNVGQQPIKNKKPLLSQKIESKIERLIRDGIIPVGGKLPTELEFCDKYSVSRNAIRPALNSLSARGLIKIIKGSGAYVNDLDSKIVTDPLNLYFEMSNSNDLLLHTIHMRQLVEPEVAGIAAMKRTSAHLKKLESNLKKMEDCPLENIEEETEIDRQFHSLVTEAAGNPVLNLLMEPVYNLITKYGLKVFGKSFEITSQTQKDVLVNSHNDIFDAIKNRDGREAYFVMRQHIKLTEKNYKRNIKLGDDTSSLIDES